MQHKVAIENHRSIEQEDPMVLVRQELGDVLRDFRLQKGRTLRQVAGRASVALGYLSEVERGQKEASSEILSSVAEALDVPISVIMREVSDRMAIHEGVKFNASFAPAAAYGDGSFIPDTVPDLFMADFDGELLGSH
jgi:transcriptional regulator with XRE-family HTH domain